MIPPRPLERILVACDGSADSVGALRVAGALADASGAGVRVVTVAEPLPVFDTGFMVALPESEMQESRRQEIRQRVEEARREAGGDAPSWPLHVATGTPAATIAGEAGAWKADLVVAGLGSHGTLDRIFGTETVLQLLHLASVPVLAVPGGASGLPRRPLLALDLSEFGVRAARAALRFLDPADPVHLVHVLVGTEHLPADDTELRSGMESEVRAGLHAQIRALGLDPDEVRLHLRAGRAADEILEAAGEVDADLLVAGSHGHSFMGRLLLGSVSTRLVREGGRSILVVPPPGAEPGAAPRVSAAPGEPHPWARLLDGFTRRHAGRRASMDVQALSWGARQTGTNFPLRGVDYDPRDDRVDIVLGEEGSGAPHLTHGVRHPRRVEVLEDARGREIGLRVEAERTVVTVSLQPPGPAADRPPPPAGPSPDESREEGGDFAGPPDDGERG